MMRLCKVFLIVSLASNRARRLALSVVGSSQGRALTAVVLTFSLLHLVVPDRAKAGDLSNILFEHLMISTDDFQETVDWYRDKLDFKLIRQWTTPHAGGTEHAYLTRNGFVIEIVTTPEAFQTQDLPADLAQILSNRGVGTLTFLTRDVDNIAHQLAARGVDPLLGPIDLEHFGSRSLFIRDNNGNVIEFMTPVSSN